MTNKTDKLPCPLGVDDWLFDTYEELEAHMAIDHAREIDGLVALFELITSKLNAGHDGNAGVKLVSGSVVKIARKPDIPRLNGSPASESCPAYASHVTSLFKGLCTVDAEQGGEKKVVVFPGRQIRKTHFSLHPQPCSVHAGTASAFLDTLDGFSFIPGAPQASCHKKQPASPGKGERLYAGYEHGFFYVRATKDSTFAEPREPLKMGYRLISRNAKDFKPLLIKKR